MSEPIESTPSPEPTTVSPKLQQLQQLPQGERNPGASFQQKLRNRARETGEDGALLQLRFVGERFLYRLSQSKYRDRFVLRGATMFTVWNAALLAADKEEGGEGEEDSRPMAPAMSPISHRATRDVDLLAFGDNSGDAMRTVLTEICAQIVPEDGLVFLTDTLKIEERTEARAYEGLHVEMQVALGTARPRLEIDIAFGESVTPAPEIVDVPPVLPSLPAPSLPAYPRITVIAEKCNAMTQLGMANTRMKDFYDLWFLSRTFAFDGAELATALKATFTRRGTPFPMGGDTTALSDAFATDAIKRQQWKAFLGKIGGGGGPTDTTRKRNGESNVSLSEVIEALQTFLQPVLAALADDKTFTGKWMPGGSWEPEESE